LDKKGVFVAWMVSEGGFVVIDAEKQAKREQEVAFAAMGKRVTDNPAYRQAFDIRRAKVFDVFCNTKQDQSDVRDEAWRTMQNLNALEQYFNDLLTTGKMAQQDLDKLTK
jgi:hypothetical protein